jgi:predicted ester cyclase
MRTVLELAAAANDAFNNHDLERLRSLVAEDVITEAPGDVRREGADAALGYIGWWLSAFSDARLVIRRRYADADTVVTEHVFQGTHDGPLSIPGGEIPATDRRVSGRGCLVASFAAGRAIEEHYYFDQLELLRQLGVIAAPTGESASTAKQ